MKQIIFALVCSLLLIGCGGKSANTSPEVVDGLPCDTVWMIFDVTGDSIYAIVHKLFCIYGDIGEPKLQR